MDSAPLQVLFLDDNADTREMVTLLLRFSDIEVLAVATPDEAVSLLERAAFDAFMMDLIGAGEGSLHLCRKLKETCPEVPIIIYSGLGSKNDIDKGIDAGASAYVVKPFVDDLARVVKTTVDEAGANEIARDSSA